MLKHWIEFRAKSNPNCAIPRSPDAVKAQVNKRNGRRIFTREEATLGSKLSRDRVRAPSSLTRTPQELLTLHSGYLGNSMVE